MSTTSETPEYVQTDREKAFLAKVEDTRHERDIINGLDPFFSEKVPADMLGLYTSNELVQLRVLKGTERDLEKRMPVKVTRHYFDLAKQSAPLRRLVKADPAGYAEVASFKVPGSGDRPSWSHMVILDGLLYLREGDAILCYDVRSGE